MNSREERPAASGGRCLRWHSVLTGELANEVGSADRRTPRDWTVDLLLFGWAVGLWLLMTLAFTGAAYLPRWLVAVDAPLGALCCLTLWWRRRRPLLVALAMVPVGAISDSAFGALMVVILNLGLRVPWKRGLPVLGLYVVASVPYVLLYSVPHEGWATAIFVLAYYLVFFLWGTALRARRMLIAQLRAETARERAEHARRLGEARRAERGAIAREMHDVLAHRISLLSVHASALVYRAEQAEAGTAPALPGPEIADSARVIRDNAHQALDELRGVLRILRDDPAADPPRSAELPEVRRPGAAPGDGDPAARRPRTGPPEPRQTEPEPERGPEPGPGPERGSEQRREPAPETGSASGPETGSASAPVPGNAAVTVSKGPHPLGSSAPEEDVVGQAEDEGRAPGGPSGAIGGRTAPGRAAATTASAGVWPGGRRTERARIERPQPTLTDLVALLEEARRAGQRVTYRDSAGAAAQRSLSAHRQRTIFRTVQEGLTNARKHAPGQEVTVRLYGAPGERITVSVRNPLSRARPRARVPGAGMGLTGLGERVALDGGTLEHGCRGGWFELAARLPWPD
ncbi:hypothetical protein E0L36_20210 [Streptomyces sp. AJS327]|uniref:sensor histidine kinase n=1 Tax=Streptomyces sp. AJS327 TaxID=2545265 RepID=UPI0015DFDE8A|nr:sensor histidine kinase [Streptomyces sp. AJS327]MBA0053111.1 hypothetical protein [Streptomyces sp. AJS327]